jgi:hypothetical protein
VSHIRHLASVYIGALEEHLIQVKPSILHSSSTAGTDGVKAWAAARYREEIVEKASNWMEYRRESSSDDSHFAKVWGFRDAKHQIALIILASVETKQRERILAHSRF